MTTRALNVQAPCNSHYEITRPDGSVIQGGRTYVFTVNGSVVGTPNPRYKDQIVRHVDASTGYSREECLMAIPARHRHTTVQCTSNGVFTARQNSSWLSVTGGAGVDDALRDKALLILKRKLSSSAARVPAMAPLAELRELRGLIRGLAETVSVKAVVKYAAARASAEKRYPLTGGRRSADLNAALKQRRKLLSSAWLQINFGLLPMMSDVASVSSAIAARLEGYPQTERLVAVASKDWVTGGKYTVNSAGSFSRTVHSVSSHHSLSYMYVAGVAPKILSGNNYGVADQFGFAWNELPGVAWELTPYSWLFDYFANVGEYFSDTFECPPGFSTYITLSKRYTCETQEVPGAELLYPGYGTISDDYSSPGRFQYLSFSREKISSLPHIGFRFKSDDEVGSHAVSKLLNLLSVYLQRK